MASVKSNSQRQVSLSLKQTGSRGQGSKGGSPGQVKPLPGLGPFLWPSFTSLFSADFF